jgi:hypothetical protein
VVQCRGGGLLAAFIVVAGFIELVLITLTPPRR